MCRTPLGLPDEPYFTCYTRFSELSYNRNNTVSARRTAVNRDTVIKLAKEACFKPCGVIRRYREEWSIFQQNRNMESKLGYYLSCTAMLHSGTCISTDYLGVSRF